MFQCKQLAPNNGIYEKMKNMKNWNKSSQQNDNNFESSLLSYTSNQSSISSEIVLTDIYLLHSGAELLPSTVTSATYYQVQPNPVEIFLTASLISCQPQDYLT